MASTRSVRDLARAAIQIAIGLALLGGPALRAQERGSPSIHEAERRPSLARMATSVEGPRNRDWLQYFLYW